MRRKVAVEQISLLPPDAAALLHLVRENLRLLAELAVRYEVAHVTPSPEALTIRKPADVAAYLGPEMADLAQEQLRVILLDTKNHVLGTRLVYQGGVNSVVIRLGDVFRDAVAVGAAAILLCHNHPSGDASASQDDIRLTLDAGKAGELLGIQVLDHIILGCPSSYVSLREKGLYTPPGSAA
ncbi:MAG: JAB domain-containing protein [Anaerolineae bacterium]